MKGINQILFTVVVKQNPVQNMNAENVLIILLECASLFYLKVLPGYRVFKASIPCYCVSWVLASPTPLAHSTV